MYHNGKHQLQIIAHRCLLVIFKIVIEDPN